MRIFRINPVDLVCAAVGRRRRLRRDRSGIAAMAISPVATVTETNADAATAKTHARHVHLLKDSVDRARSSRGRSMPPPPAKSAARDRGRQIRRDNARILTIAEHRATRLSTTCSRATRICARSSHIHDETTALRRELLAECHGDVAAFDVHQLMTNHGALKGRHEGIESWRKRDRRPKKPKVHGPRLPVCWM